MKGANREESIGDFGGLPPKRRRRTRLVCFGCKAPVPWEREKSQTNLFGGSVDAGEWAVVVLAIAKLVVRVVVAIVEQALAGMFPRRLRRRERALTMMMFSSDVFCKRGVCLGLYHMSAQRLPATLLGLVFTCCQPHEVFARLRLVCRAWAAGSPTWAAVDWAEVRGYRDVRMDLVASVRAEEFRAADAARVPNLRSLQMSAMIVEHDLLALGRPLLEVLHAPQCSVNDLPLAEIRRLKLRSVPTHALTGLSHLEALALHNVDEHNLSMLPLQLTDLRLGSGALSGPALAAIAALGNLRVLGLNADGHGPGQLGATLAKLSRLQTLRLTGSSCPMAEVEYARGLTYASLCVDRITRLPSLPCLTRLQIFITQGPCPLTVPAEAELPALTELRSSALNLEGTLSGLPRLQVLTAHALDRACWQTLPQTINELDLWTFDVVDDIAPEEVNASVETVCSNLDALTGLRTLRIRGWRFHQQARIAHLTQLHAVCLSGKCIKSAADLTGLPRPLQVLGVYRMCADADCWAAMRALALRKLTIDMITLQELAELAVHCYCQELELGHICQFDDPLANIRLAGLNILERLLALVRVLRVPRTVFLALRHRLQPHHSVELLSFSS